MQSSPIVVCGTGRSGTSVFTRLIGLHPNIFAFRWETQLFSGIPGLAECVLRSFGRPCIESFIGNLEGRLFRRTVERPSNTYDAGLFEIIDSGDLTLLVNQFRKDLDSAKSRQQRLRSCAELVNGVFARATSSAGAHRWCEKTPRNLLYASVIREIFPDARFINVVRDGRDVASSILEKKFWPVAKSIASEHTKNLGGDITFENCVAYWRNLIRAGREQELRVGPDHWLTIRFEDLTEKPEATFRTVLAFLEEPFDPAVLDPESKILRRRRPDDLAWGDIAHLGRWRRDLSVAQARYFEKEAGDELQHYHYPLLRS